MKDVRILWNDISSNNDIRPKISELIVEEFSNPHNLKEWLKDKEHGPMHLYDKYRCDIGNCLDDWEKWAPIQIILYLYVNYGFVNREIEKNALLELMKINELKEDIIQILIARGWLERDEA